MPRSVICLALGTSRSASYYHRMLPDKDKPRLDKIIKVLISNPGYGVYRLKLHFELEGERISQAKIRRICSSSGIEPKRKSRRPTARDSNTPHTGMGNLIDGIVPDSPDQIWCGDFSYFRVNGVWMNLATVIDSYTKEILGFSLSTNHTSNPVCNALPQETLARCLTPLLCSNVPVIRHSFNTR